MDGRIKAGSAVTLHSLVGKPELNGCSGVVTSFDEQCGRYRIQLNKITGEQAECAVKIKPSNLRLKDCDKVTHFASLGFLKHSTRHKGCPIMFCLFSPGRDTHMYRVLENLWRHQASSVQRLPRSVVLFFTLPTQRLAPAQKRV